MRRALAEYHVGGIKTNLPFHRQVMRHPAFIAGEYDTGFIERHKAELQPASPDEETAALAAVVAAAHAQANGPGGAPGAELDLSKTEIPAWRRDKS
jgi:acetyl/propionyl-CoA carboxylase alpha subunit